MYNTAFPTQAELPSTRRLVRSTIIAAASALAILVTVVLPSEYGIDPTGLGRLTGLSSMGEIKMQLAAEAAANQALSTAVATGASVPRQAPPPGPDIAALESRIAAVEQMLADARAGQSAALPPLPAAAQAEIGVATADGAVPASAWRDEISFTLTPGQGAEYKLAMQAGAVADYEFAVAGGVINVDIHGEGEGQSLSYGEGRGLTGDAGQLVPPISGTHGWFFRNRGSTDVVVTLRVRGDYTEMRQIS